MSLFFTFKSRQYTRAGVYGKCMLYQNQIAFNGVILGTEFEEVEEASERSEEVRRGRHKKMDWIARMRY